MNSTSTPSDSTTDIVDENKLIAQRRDKLASLREQGTAYPNHFRRDNTAQALHQAYGQKNKEQLEADDTLPEVSVAGRMMLRRVMGKASFCTLQDVSGRIQIYVRKNELPEGVYNQFKTWDLGDIVGVRGTVFKTNTGELSLHATHIELITKSLRPLPDKFHGMTDTELRYRQRYVDLMVNEDTQKLFLMRSKIVHFIRSYLIDRTFMEVETPMLQVIPGGATAKPFETHHQALDLPMYLRIAPELYLKRLLVGGFERVFEINRNFRNEGLSTRHNPEFTMLEFYQAYADYRELMDLTEDLLRQLCQHIFNSTSLHYQGQTYDLSQPFKRVSMVNSIIEFDNSITLEQLSNIDTAKALAKTLGIEINDQWGLGKYQTEIFEKIVEPNLFAPTFITEYPAEVSPLARPNNDNPFITDRFEFFLGGREVANGFSELNDADLQAERFKAQVAAKNSGDDEAMHYDADYIRALEYGMPPAAGEGIGIDRLVMVFADTASIRDVILFPHMRPE